MYQIFAKDLSNDTKLDPPPPPPGGEAEYNFDFLNRNLHFLLQNRIPRTKIHKSSNFQVISMSDDAVIGKQKN